MLVFAVLALWILGLAAWVALKLRQPRLDAPKPPSPRPAHAFRHHALEDRSVA